MAQIELDVNKETKDRVGAAILNLENSRNFSNILWKIGHYGWLKFIQNINKTLYQANADIVTNN